MPRRVQGTQVWFVDPQNEEPRLLGQITDLQPGGAPFDPIDVTTVDDYTRENIPGLRAPGQLTFSINLEPGNYAHRRLHEIFLENPSNQNDTLLNWIIGWSDGTSSPTADSALEPVLPTTRTWYTTAGYIADMPFSFPLGGVVNGQIAIQKSGAPTWQRKQ